jgi:hypothetical protein
VDVLFSRQVGNPYVKTVLRALSKSPYSIDEFCGFLDTVDSADPDAGSINPLKRGVNLFEWAIPAAPVEIHHW